MLKSSSKCKGSKKKKSVLVKKQLAKGDEGARQKRPRKPSSTTKWHLLSIRNRSPPRKLCKNHPALSGRSTPEKRVGGRSGRVSAQRPRKRYARTLSALSLRDPALIERYSIDVEKDTTENPSVMRRSTPKPSPWNCGNMRWLKIIDQLARSSKTLTCKTRAAALLQSPEYNLLSTFQDARSDRQLESVKYVLLGEDLLRKT